MPSFLPFPSRKHFLLILSFTKKKIITLFKSICHSSTSILNIVLKIQLIYKFIYNNEALFKNVFIFFSIIYQKIRAVILRIKIGYTNKLLHLFCRPTDYVFYLNCTLKCRNFLYFPNMECLTFALTTGCRRCSKSYVSK